MTVTAEIMLRDLYTASKRVMDTLSQHGASIVPHLLDTDDNAGEVLRQMLREVGQYVATVALSTDHRAAGLPTSVECPTCHEPVGYRCTTRLLGGWSHQRKPVKAHVARVRAAAPPSPA